MATRPTRRAAARRNAIVDSDDEIAGDANQTIHPDDEENFIPAPAAATRRKTAASRRKTIAAEAPAVPKKQPVRTRRTRASVAASGVEASGIFDPDQTAATVAPSVENDENIEDGSVAAAKKPTPRMRKSVAPSKVAPPKFETPEMPSQVSVASSISSIPTPQPSASPEPSGEQGESAENAENGDPAGPAKDELARDVSMTPLSDITSSAINERPRTADETIAAAKPINAMDTVLEKPMDIMIKSRNMTTVVPPVEPAAPKARTVITYLVLTNFKSYAGRQEVGPFHASFSSVVGPNGSGKSNVIDSLLFVFGFRASKMRQGKLSALIHNSAQFPNLDFCEVAVHFREVMDLVRTLPISCYLSQLFLTFYSPAVAQR